MSAERGVPVTRVQGVDSLVFFCHTDLHEPTHTVFGIAAAAALVDVAEAARLYASSASTPALWRALDRLNEARR